MAEIKEDRGKALRKAYRTINEDQFPARMEISLFDEGGAKQTLAYEKATWEIGGEEKGLRYGENPDQQAALYRLVNGNIVLGETETIAPGRWLASDMELLQSGKHPGKINITDVDSALNILRYLTDQPAAVIMKHNNPSGAALGSTLEEAYRKALLADRIAAFGGAVALNGPVDTAAARAIAESYCEVVAAPAYEEGAVEILAARKNLRIVRIANMDRLQDYVGRRMLDAKSLIDGGMILQWSYAPKALSREDMIPAEQTRKGETYRISRMPTEAEYRDILFGWLVEAGVTSNSVIYVKDGVTVGIGTGEQDRVGVAEIARDKAYRKMADRLSWVRYGTPWHLLNDRDRRVDIEQEVAEARGGLSGAVMVSDAFFPFRDGVDVGLKQGVSAVVQPGGSLRDYESIQACNEAGAAMVFTGQRSFRH